MRLQLIVWQNRLVSCLSVIHNTNCATVSECTKTRVKMLLPGCHYTLKATTQNQRDTDRIWMNKFDYQGQAGGPSVRMGLCLFVLVVPRIYQAYEERASHQDFQVKVIICL